MSFYFCFGGFVHGLDAEIRQLGYQNVDPASLVPLRHLFFFNLDPLQFFLARWNSTKFLPSLIRFSVFEDVPSKNDYTLSWIDHPSAALCGAIEKKTVL